MFISSKKRASKWFVKPLFENFVLLRSGGGGGSFLSGFMFEYIVVESFEVAVDVGINCYECSV